MKTQLSRFGKQDALYDALYRRVAAKFGISTCELMIYYYLILEEGNATQSKLCSQMMFPKQTVNSAVTKLVKCGMLTLTEGEGKRKIISLTPQGESFAQRTVEKLFQAELRATKQLGAEKMRLLCEIRGEYLDLLSLSFERDFLKNNE